MLLLRNRRSERPPFERVYVDPAGASIRCEADGHRSIRPREKSPLLEMAPIGYQTSERDRERELTGRHLNQEENMPPDGFKRL
jgi:hypothetical protein